MLSLPYHQAKLIKKGVNLSAFLLLLPLHYLLSVVVCLPAEKMQKNEIQ